MLASSPCPVASRFAWSMAQPSSQRKLEAFKGRGKGDYVASSDIEDVIAVVDGRPELPDEVAASTPELRAYLSDELQTLLDTPEFRESIAGHLPGDSASQERVPRLLSVFRNLVSRPRHR